MERHSAYRAYGRPTYSTAGKQRELNVLKLLARYDLLPSSFIQHQLGNYEATKQTLRNLVKGHYIGLPDIEETGDKETDRRAKLAYIPRNAFYVYELKPRGKALLVLQGTFPKAGGNDHFKHRLLRSKLEYLLDRVPEPLVVRTDDDILRHNQCPPATRKLPYPFRIPPAPALEPDITRGFGDGENFVFLHIEVDRGTEPKRSLKARQSLSGKIERYVQYFTQKAHETHFGLRYAPSVLIMTTRNTDGLADLLRECAGAWAHRFFFIDIPLNILPTTNLFVPWQGVDGTLDLMEKFNGLPEESRPRERTGQGD